MWPELPYESWQETLDTLHMWMQIAGKIKLELSPFLNQWWETAFYVTPTGMTTGRIPYNKGAFSMDFDFVNHVFVIKLSSGQIHSLPLKPQSVAEFYEKSMHTLKTLGISVSIYSVPVEFAETIPFERDTKHNAYDKEAVEKWWSILLKSTLVFDRFRSSFRGKSSPIHFYWGSFDLNGTRFSGALTTPPKMKGIMKNIMQFAENEENFAFGFWPGDQKFPHPAYFSYMYPSPSGFNTQTFDQGVSFNEQLGECVLLYDDVRDAKDPDKKILHFLDETYTISARLAGWDIKSLTAQTPKKKNE